MSCSLRSSDTAQKFGAFEYILGQGFAQASTSTTGRARAYYVSKLTGFSGAFSSTQLQHASNTSGFDFLNKF